MKKPGGDLWWENVFMFKSDRSHAESVVWNRYAASLAEVHALGCYKQRQDRAAGKSKATYFGAIHANVGEIRGLRSKNGIRFDVVHEPKEGPHHAHIKYEFHNRAPTPNDKSELKVLLRKKFSNPPSGHMCPEEVKIAGPKQRP